MKLFGRGTGVMIAALALFCGACGPDEAKIEVTTTDTLSGVMPDTVIVRDTTVVQPGGTDTIVRRDTVVQRQVDTVVRRDTVRLPPVSASERARIDSWLRANDATLNEYGDPEGTMYTGNSPLFNEATGATMTKYQYIVRQHPDKPWMRTQPAPPSTPQPAESQSSRPRR